MRGAIRVQSPRLYGNPYYAGIAPLPELPRLTIYHNSIHGQFMCTKYGRYKCVRMWHLYHHNVDQSAFKNSPGAVEVAESKYEQAKQELEEVISELQDD